MDPEVIEMMDLDAVLKRLSTGEKAEKRGSVVSNADSLREWKKNHGEGSKASSKDDGKVPWRRWIVNFMPVLVSALVSWFIVEQVQSELDEVRIELALYDERYLQLTNDLQGLQDSLGRESTALSVLQFESVRLDTSMQRIQEDMSGFADLTDEIQEMSSELAVQQQTLGDNTQTLLFLEQSSTAQSAELLRIGGESIAIDTRLQLVQEDLADITDLTDEIHELTSDLAEQQQTLGDNTQTLLFLEQSSTAQSAELLRIGGESVAIDTRLQLVQEDLADITDLTDEIQELKSELAVQQQTLGDNTQTLLFLEQSSTAQSAELLRIGGESVAIDTRLQLVQEDLADITDVADEIQELSSNLATQQQTLDDTELSLLFLEQSSTVQSAELLRIGRGLDSQVDLLGEVSEQLEVVNQENDVALITIAEAQRVAEESAALIGPLAQQFEEETSKFCKPSDYVVAQGASRVYVSSTCVLHLGCRKELGRCGAFGPGENAFQTPHNPFQCEGGNIILEPEAGAAETMFDLRAFGEMEIKSRGEFCRDLEDSVGLGPVETQEDCFALAQTDYRYVEESSHTGDYREVYYRDDDFNSANFPPGCFYNYNSYNGYYSIYYCWNSHPTGGSISETTRPVCAAAWPTTECSVAMCCEGDPGRFE
jgi:hypothetical protein